MSTKDCWNYLPNSNGDTYLAGGGANSSFLCQLTSDFLGRSIIKTSNKEMGICGIVEAVKIALQVDLKIDNSDINVQTRFDPNQQNSQTIEKMYNNFIDIRDSMEMNWDQRAKFVNM